MVMFSETTLRALLERHQHWCRQLRFWPRVIRYVARRGRTGPRVADVQACKDGICGTTIVIGIAAFYLLTQFWITGVSCLLAVQPTQKLDHLTRKQTICETLASAAAGSFKSGMSRAVAQIQLLELIIVPCKKNCSSRVSTPGFGDNSS